MNFFRNRLVSLLSVGVLVVVALVALSALPQHAAPQTASNELLLEFEPAQSELHWTLGSTFHTVHGTFALKKGTVGLDPASGKASGEVVVDATSGNSGNDGRDKKMHKQVLESARYAEIVFRPDHVEGKVARQGPSMVQVHGRFVLHGSEHELTIPVHAELAGDHWTGSAKFSIPFIDWGLRNPSNFFLKVDHAVEIDLAVKGKLQGPATP